MKTDKLYPFPWTHRTDGKKVSAVVDANGNVVCGSLICEQRSPKKVRQAHANIVKAVNGKAKPGSHLSWSTEMPTVPGWYFCRYKSFTEVWKVEQNLIDENAFKHDEKGTEWAGPIPEPKDK